VFFITRMYQGTSAQGERDRACPHIQGIRASRPTHLKRCQARGKKKVSYWGGETKGGKNRRQSLPIESGMFDLAQAAFFLSDPPGGKKLGEKLPRAG